MSNLVEGFVNPIPTLPVPLELNNSGVVVIPVVYVAVPEVPLVNDRPSVTTNTLLLLFMFVFVCAPLR